MECQREAQENRPPELTQAGDFWFGGEAGVKLSVLELHSREFGKVTLGVPTLLMDYTSSKAKT